MQQMRGVRTNPVFLLLQAETYESYPLGSVHDLVLVIHLSEKDNVEKIK